MNWKKHLFYGIIIQLIFIFCFYYFFNWFNFTNPFILGQMLILIMISPLIPDLDHKMGKLHLWIMTLGFLIAFLGIIYWVLETKTNLVIGDDWIIFIVLGVIISGATFFNAHYSKHRGFWHSNPMGLIYGTIIILLTGGNLQLGVLAFIGFWSHLLLDKQPFKFN